MTLPNPIDIHGIGGLRQHHEEWHEALHSVYNGTEATAGKIVLGTATPEGAVVAPPGTLYVDTDGGAGVTLWVKEANVDDTGWVAMATDT
jgi:hypothetical protein